MYENFKVQSVKKWKTVFFEVIIYDMLFVVHEMIYKL